MRQLTTVFFCFFIMLSQVKAQDPIKTLPEKAATAYKAALSKIGLTISNQNNAFWIKEDVSSDVIEYDISLNKATTLPFKAIIVIRYFQDKSGEDQVEIQLRFKMQDLKNATFKPFSEIAFKKALSKCKPSNYTNDDFTTLKINYDYKNGVLSNPTYKISYYLLNLKKSIDEDCDEEKLDEEEIEELIQIRNKL